MFSTDQNKLKSLIKSEYFHLDIPIVPGDSITKTIMDFVQANATAPYRHARCPGINNPPISTGDRNQESPYSYALPLDHAYRTLPTSTKFNLALPPGFRMTINYPDLVPDIERHIRVFAPECNPESGFSGLV